MKYKITLDGRTYEIEVVEENAMLLSEYEAIAPTAPAAAPVAPAAPAAAPAPTITGAGESVNTPMPGTILQVLVSVGQTVKEGDVLVVLEAMKMENEITSPKNGTVTQVIAQPGTTVDTGVALVVIQ